MSQRETKDGCTLTRSGRVVLSLGALFILTLGALPKPAASAELNSLPYQCSPEQKEFLDQLQRRTFKYFWDSSGDSGLTPDRAPGADTCSVAAVGFALTSYLVGAEHGYVSRDEAAHRTYAALKVLWQAPQGPAAAGVAGFNGFFYHFLDGHQGLRSADSELSTIDTALLMAGVLSSLAYFDRNDEVERSIRQLSDDLYRRVDWSWAYSRHHPPLLTMGWSPEHGFIDSDWRGYNEGMILYLLALGSPTHPIEPGAWDEWTHDYVWEDHDGTPSVTFGPLFGHQYSHVWIDFRGIQDGIMRSKGSDYFMNSTRAAYANRAYCIANPGKWKGYGEYVWGLTASDGPLREVPGSGTEPTPFHAYWARGAGVSAAADDGTIAPTAVGGSVPFAPEVAIPTLVNLRDRFGDRLYGQYGFKDAFNLSYSDASSSGQGWFDDQYLGIDEGAILLMVENYRTGFVWDLLKKSPYLIAGLKKAGFTGGWLTASSVQNEPPPSPAPQPRVTIVYRETGPSALVP